VILDSHADRFIELLLAGPLSVLSLLRVAIAPQGEIDEQSANQAEKDGQNFVLKILNGEKPHPLSPF
jgi:hypothetical protein